MIEIWVDGLCGFVKWFIVFIVNNLMKVFGF